MKVLLVTTCIDKSFGGPARSVPLLARGLSAAGVDVTLMVVRSDDMNDALLDGSGVKLKVLEKGYKVREVREFIAQEKFDLVHGQAIWEPLCHFARVAATKCGVPFISTPRGSLEPWSLEQKRIKKLVAMLLYQKRDLNASVRIHATSTLEAENIRALGIKTPIAVVPNCIDVDSLPCRTSTEGVKKQVLFLSRIHPKKGIEMLLDAWDAIHENFPDWNLVIAGNGDPIYTEELHGAISRMGLSRCVRMLPSRFGKDKLALYAESALFVLPSFSENFGVVIAEALACGVPVITTTNTPWELINGKHAGWCINLGQEELENALVEAMSKDLDELLKMGTKGSEFVRKAFSVPVIASATLKMYEAALDS